MKVLISQSQAQEIQSLKSASTVALPYIE